ncbi:MAG TPA: mechanosensitive ion channel family protein [Acidimicrobiales bacterium]|nr:mechanosensitive ion channel family protein [Acidimicrobiales bacterium]
MAATDHGYVYELFRKLGLSDFQASTGEFLLVRPLRVLLLVVLAVIAGRLAARGIKRLIRSAQRRSPLRAVTPRADQRADTVAEVLANLVRITLLGCAALMALGQFGINPGPLIAGAGIAGVAIGFGAQSMVKDFLAGVFILVEDQYGVGDTVDLSAEVSGTVEDVTLRVTRLRSADGTVWFVPNGEIRRVGNASMEFSRALVDVPIARSADVEAALVALSEEASAMVAAEPWSQMITGPPEVHGVHGLTNDAVTIRATLTTRPGQQHAVARELRTRVAARLARDASA